MRPVGFTLPNRERVGIHWGSISWSVTFFDAHPRSERRIAPLMDAEGEGAICGGVVGAKEPYKNPVKAAADWPDEARYGSAQ